MTLLVTMLTATTAWAQTTQFPTTSGGSGTSEDPYKISSTDDLDKLATDVNGGNDYSGKYFVLTADIEYSHTTAWNDATSTEENFTAIGNDSKPFKGTFDGDGHVISGIRIYKSGNNDADKYQALFGQINGATVKNVILADARITGYSFSGGIVGKSNDGCTVENCHALNNVTIHAVQGWHNRHGGIAGHNGGTVTGCTSAAAVTIAAGKTYCTQYGGIAGTNTGTVKDCLYLGTTLNGSASVGAIVGYNYAATVTNSYYTDPAITGKDGDGNALDHAASALGNNHEGTVTNCGPALTVTLDEGISLVGTTTEYGKLTAYDNVALDYNDGTGTTIYSTTGNEITLSSYTGTVPDGYSFAYSVNGTAIDGLTFTMPAADVTVSPNFAYIPWTGSGTTDDPYIIIYPSQLDLLAQRVNSGMGDDHAADGYGGRHFKLGADIEYTHNTAWNDAASTEENFTRIGNNSKPFKGTFDGDGHTISGIRIYKVGTNDADGYQGLFGYIQSAKVENIILADARITGYDDDGGIVGYNNGCTVENCHVLSTVTVHAIQNNAFYHGGIVGRNSYGTVTGCTSAAAITFADGKSGCNHYGGIAGYNSGTVKDCLYLGTTLNGTKRVGAIVGNSNSDGTVTNSYYTDPAITGKDNSGAALDHAASALGYNDGGTVAATVGLALRDDADNTGFLTLMAARTEALAAVTRTPALTTAATLALHGRTLLKNGDWNTLCLPFSLTAEQIAASPLAGATIKELLSTSNLDGEGKLTLKFQDATAITAGKPYMVKWAPADNLTNPVFNNVTIDNTENNVSFTGGSFKGTYAPLEITDANRDKVLLLATGNKLGYAKTDRTVANGKALGTCRAYFEITGAAAVRSFIMDFGENATSIIEVGADSSLFNLHSSLNEGWYTLDGRRLQGKPTQKGVYIQNGKKVIIK